MSDWQAIESAPNGRVVETKIDDAKGLRNEQPLKRQGNLWFSPDGSMYVYYTPTHWREPRPPSTSEGATRDNYVSKQLVLDWLTGYAGPEEPEFFGQFLTKLEWRIKNEPRISPEELMDAVAMVEDEGLWKFDQPKWYEALGEAIAHLIAERRWSNAAQPNEPPAGAGTLDSGKLAARIACKVWELCPIGSIGRMDLTRYIREEIERATRATPVSTEAELARTGPPPACHAMITPETSCELPKGHSGEHSGATPASKPQESREPHETAGQILADDILKRIAKRYENCNLNIYPDMPHLTPVEAVLRCAMEEGFVLRAASPSSDLRTWITGAQFMVTPKEAPDGNAPLHVVTVEGLLKWLDEREAGR